MAAAVRNISSFLLAAGLNTSCRVTVPVRSEREAVHSSVSSIRVIFHLSLTHYALQLARSHVPDDFHYLLLGFTFGIIRCKYFFGEKRGFVGDVTNLIKFKFL